jgi:hypothetical protein
MWPQLYKFMPAFFSISVDVPMVAYFFHPIQLLPNHYAEVSVFRQSHCIPYLLAVDFNQKISHVLI